MGMRREELSTADLAGQPPTSAERSDVTARDDRTEAADRTDDDVARADLAPEDLARDDDVARDDLAAEDRAPEDLARDDLAPEDLARDDNVARDDLAPGLARDDHPGEPALTEGRSPDRATEVEPGDEPQPLRQDDGRHEVTATGTDPDLASSAAPAAQAAADAGTADTATKAGHLLAADDTEAFRARWTDVQHGFVDAPRQAVTQADGLVAELMQHLAKTFADERGRLEGQWDQGDDVSTEDLRTAFQRYRLFFERLLTT
jgi:hypothetical protein